METKTLKKQVGAVKEPRGRAAKYAEEEKANVLEIISDLEQQLETAFGIKESQAKDITRLEKDLEKERQKNDSDQARIREMGDELVSQEKLNFDLEFLENERLESIGQKQSLEEGLKRQNLEKEELAKNIEQLDKDINSRQERIEQLEEELSGAHATIQNFQDHIHAAEKSKEDLRKRVEEKTQEMKVLNEEKEQYERDLKGAKESLEEIHVMLAETRAKAKGRYSKK